MFEFSERTRRLRAVPATPHPEAIKDAEIEAVFTAHDERLAPGSPVPGRTEDVVARDPQEMRAARGQSWT